MSSQDEKLSRANSHRARIFERRQALHNLTPEERLLRLKSRNLTDEEIELKERWAEPIEGDVDIPVWPIGLSSRPRANIRKKGTQTIVEKPKHIAYVPYEEDVQKEDVEEEGQYEGDESADIEMERKRKHLKKYSKHARPADESESAGRKIILTDEDKKSWKTVKYDRWDINPRIKKLILEESEHSGVSPSEQDKLKYAGSFKMRTGRGGFLYQPHIRAGISREPVQVAYHLTRDDPGMIPRSVYRRSQPVRPRLPGPPKSYTGGVRVGSRMSFSIEKERFTSGIAADITGKDFSIINTKTGAKKTYALPRVGDRKLFETPDENKSSRVGFVLVSGRDVSLGKDSSKWSDENEIELGNLIELRFLEKETITGTLIGFGDDFYRIKHERNEYEVSFDNPSILLLPRRKKLDTSIISKPSTLGYYLAAPVDTSLRQMVRDILYRTFSEVVPNTKIVPHKTSSDPDFEDESEIGGTSDFPIEDLEVLRAGIRPWWTGDITFIESTSDNDKGVWIVKWEFEEVEYAKEYPIPNFMEKDDVYREAESFAKNDYYSENFRGWFYSKMLPKLNERLPEELEDEAWEIVDQWNDPEFVVSYLTARHGRDLFDLTGFEFKKRMSETRNMKPIDVYINSSLERIGSDKTARIWRDGTGYETVVYKTLDEEQGYDLAVILTGIIAGYMRTYPPNVYNIHRDLKTNWILEEFNKMEPTAADQEQFDEENLADLTDRYREFVKRYESVKKRAEIVELRSKESERGKVELRRKITKHIKKRRSGISPESVHTDTYYADMYADMSEDGFDLLLQVETFEKNCYAACEESQAGDYLSKTLYPLAFIGGPLEEEGELKVKKGGGSLYKYADFFRAKIASGDIKVSALYSATLPYYFPELAMNFDTLNDTDWNASLDEIAREVYRKIERILYLYMYIENPTRRTRTRPANVSTFIWKKYITTVSDRCQQDSKSGKRPMRDGEGNFIYSSRGGKMVAEMEDISLGDVVICYDPYDKNFTCHTIEEISRDISRSGKKPPTNLVSGKKYPEKFIKKMRARYASEIASAGKSPVSVPRSPWTPPKPKVTSSFAKELESIFESEE